MSTRDAGKIGASYNARILLPNFHRDCGLTLVITKSLSM